ncbi:hypothetical protein PGTUg99_004355 [Puccinia graminis f. sp. tritici]|uniref:Uncharacterized protein n=1 Tax=Puccinia graminis f. sp. tritici TaxID=56615 RepID=A0A5B0NEU6_PUCGR|nr:hypothetical protein PGTUg99_004355 [Puccinia graminis f. sp. tritici]
MSWIVSRRVPSSLEYFKAFFPALLPDSSFSSPLHELHPHHQIFKRLVANGPQPPPQRGHGAFPKQCSGSG